MDGVQQVSKADYPDHVVQMYGSMREAPLQTVVMQALWAAGWVAYHTHDSRRSSAGFPDVVAVRGTRVIYRELKAVRGSLSPEQRLWRDRLLGAGQDWALWTPLDWGAGYVMEDIQRG